MLMYYLLHFLSGFVSVGGIHLTHLLFDPFPKPASCQFIIADFRGADASPESNRKVHAKVGARK
jgi:hypothetical protein